MANCEDYLRVLQPKLRDLCIGFWAGYQDDAVRDARDFLDACHQDLQHWADLLNRGDLSQSDFKWLVSGRRDVAEMNALKQRGLAETELDQFRDAVIDVVVKTAFKVFL